jgi:hypothetical protein
MFLSKFTFFSQNSHFFSQNSHFSLKIHIFLSKFTFFSRIPTKTNLLKGFASFNFGARSTFANRLSRRFAVLLVATIIALDRKGHGDQKRQKQEGVEAKHVEAKNLGFNIWKKCEFLGKKVAEKWGCKKKRENDGKTYFFKSAIFWIFLLNT